MVTILRLIHAPATPLIQTEFHLTYAKVGLITTAMFFTTGIFQVLFGAISDRIGRKIVIAAGSVAASVATILSATSYWVPTQPIFRLAKATDLLSSRLQEECHY